MNFEESEFNIIDSDDFENIVNVVSKKDAKLLETKSKKTFDTLDEQSPDTYDSLTEEDLKALWNNLWTDLTYIIDDNFYVASHYDSKDTMKKNGFWWNPTYKLWYKNTNKITFDNLKNILYFSGMGRFGRFVNKGFIDYHLKMLEKEKKPKNSKGKLLVKLHNTMKY